MKVILNHKSNLTYTEIIDYYNKIKDFFSNDNLIVCPSTCYLPIFKEITLGSQDISSYKMGSYTGEVSGEALKSLGVKYVFINHSERRHFKNETLIDVKEKLKRAKENDLIPILCIGEEKDENTMKVLSTALDYLLSDLSFNELYISYEPCYSIGTGIVPDKDKLISVFEFLHSKYNYPLFYGGSVSKENITTFKEIPYLAGVLLGKASLDIEEIKEILKQI